MGFWLLCFIVKFIFLSLFKTHFLGDRGYFEITFPPNTHKSVLQEILLDLTQTLLYSTLKNTFERFYFLRKMANCSHALLI